mgnify:CR=1 FL=1
MEVLGVGFSGIALLFLIVLGILWFFLPFAIFGTKDKFDILISETVKTNQQLLDLNTVLALQSKKEEMQYLRYEEKDAKKWKIAKIYLNEIKDALEYLNSKIDDSFASRQLAEDGLRDIFTQLGATSISQNVLDNIVQTVHGYKGKDQQRLDEEDEFKEKQKVVDLQSKKYDTTNRNIEDFVTMVSDGASSNAIEAYLSGMSQDDLEKFINLPDAADNYPLHISIYNNHLELTALLLKMGADPIVKNFWDKTPLEVATGKENHEAETLVKKHLIQLGYQ